MSAAGAADLSGRYAKTDAGRAEITGKAQPLSRPARNLLLIIDASRTAEAWLGLVQGATPADLAALVQGGLVTSSAAPAAAAQAAAAPRLSLAQALETKGYKVLYDRITAEARPRLGLIKGYKLILEVERCSGPAEIRALAQRFVEQVRAADLILVVLDASQTLHEADQEVFHLVHGEPCVIVANKCDLPVRLDLNGIRAEFPAAPIVQVSAVQGTGLDQLDEQIAETLLGSGVELGNQALVTSARHQAALDRARMALQRACETLDQDLPLELATTDLRDALDALGEITGDTVSEAILAEIFGRFCIGK